MHPRVKHSKLSHDSEDNILPSMSWLPNELWLSIFKYLKPADLRAIATVSWHFYYLVAQNVSNTELAPIIKQSVTTQDSPITSITIPQAATKPPTVFHDHHVMLFDADKNNNIRILATRFDGLAVYTFKNNQWEADPWLPFPVSPSSINMLNGIPVLTVLSGERIAMRGNNINDVIHIFKYLAQEKKWARIQSLSHPDISKQKHNYRNSKHLCSLPDGTLLILSETKVLIYRPDPQGQLLIYKETFDIEQQRLPSDNAHYISVSLVENGWLVVSRMRMRYMGTPEELEAEADTRIKEQQVFLLDPTKKRFTEPQLLQFHSLLPCHLKYSGIFNFIPGSIVNNDTILYHDESNLIAFIHQNDSQNKNLWGWQDLSADVEDWEILTDSSIQSIVVSKNGEIVCLYDQLFIDNARGVMDPQYMLDLLIWKFDDDVVLPAKTSWALAKHIPIQTTIPCSIVEVTEKQLLLFDDSRSSEKKLWGYGRKGLTFNLFNHRSEHVNDLQIDDAIYRENTYKN